MASSHEHHQLADNNIELVSDMNEVCIDVVEHDIKDLEKDELPMVHFEDTTDNKSGTKGASLSPTEMRTQAFKIAALGQIFVIVMMISIVNILYGFGWSSTTQIKNKIEIAVWTSTATSSSHIIESTLEVIMSDPYKYNLNYKFVQVTDLDIAYEDLAHAVDRGLYWGAFAVNEGASASLMQDLVYTSSDPGTVFNCAYWYDQARAGPSLQFAIGAVGASIGGILNAGVKTTIIKYQQAHALPAMLNSYWLRSPIRAETVNLHEVHSFGLFVVAGSGAMQLFLINICNSIALITIHSTLQGRGIQEIHLARFLGISRVMASFFLAFWVPAVVYMLGPGDQIYNNANTFFSIWAFTWLSLVVLGSMTYFLNRLFGAAMGGLLGISLLMLMVASVSLPMEIMPDFYKLGMALPFYSIVQGLKAVMFSSQTNLLRQSILILFAWYFALFFYIWGSLKYDSYNRYTRNLKLFPEKGDENAERRELTRRRTLSREMIDAVDADGGYVGGGNRDGDVSMSSNVVIDDSNLKTLPAPDAAMTAVEEMTIHGDKPNSINGVDAHQDFNSLNDNSIDVPNEGVGISADCHSVNDAKATDNRNNNSNNSGKSLQDDFNDTQIVNDAFEPRLSLFDPSVRPEFLLVIKKIVGLEIVLSVLFILLLLITYGNSWNVASFHKNIRVAMISFDTPAGVSPFNQVFSILSQPEPINSAIGFHVTVLDPTMYSYDNVVDFVEQGDYWGALIVNAGASANMLQAARQPSISVPSYPLTLLYNGAHGGGYVNTMIRKWGGSMAVGFGTALSSSLLATAEANITQYDAATLANPAPMTTVNLHPPQLSAPGTDSALNSAFTCLYLGMIVQAMVISASHQPFSDLGFTYYHRVMLKAGHIGFSTLLMSFVPVISMLWFGLHMNAHQFFSLWALFWLGLCAFASFITMNYHLFGQTLGGCVNILLFALNQASSTFVIPIHMQSTFFRIGFALPYNQMIVGGRYILFDTHKKDLSRACAVLFAWVFVVSVAALRLIRRRERLGYMHRQLQKGGSSLITLVREALNFDSVGDEEPDSIVGSAAGSDSSPLEPEPDKKHEPEPALNDVIADNNSLTAENV